MRHELRLVPLSTVNFDFMRSVIYTKFTDPYFPPTVYAINGDKVKNRFD